MIRIFFRVFLMLIWVVASVIVSEIFVGRIMLCFMDVETFSEPVWSAIYSALSYILAMVLIIFVPPKILARHSKNDAKHSDRKKDNYRRNLPTRNELGLSSLPTWVDIGLAPVGFVVSLLFAAALVALFSIFPWFDAAEAQEVGFSIYITGTDRIIAFITLVVVAPIAEEIIFRGWLYAKIRNCLSEKLPEIASMLISIFLVSLLFGIIHLQWNVGVNVFALSVVLCGLREVTGTIYAGILTHMIKNGVAFYLLYVLGI